MEHHLWALQLECFPQDVPTSIEADITKLGMNESLKVAELTVPDTVTVLSDPDEVIVSVVPPQILRVEEEEEAELAEGEAEGEGAPEGEAAGEGGGGSSGGTDAEG